MAVDNHMKARLNLEAKVAPFSIFFFTPKPRIEWYKSLWALNTSLLQTHVGSFDFSGQETNSIRRLPFDEFHIETLIIYALRKFTTHNDLY